MIAVGRWRRPAWTVASLLLLVQLVAPAEPLHAQSLPALTAPVTDLAHVIDQTSAAELDRRIRALQTASGDTVVVLTVPTIAPYGSIEEYAVKVFEQAKPGQRGQDNGVLIVFAATERRVRIEVGYGLEEFITDGFAGDTIRQAMLPAFRQGQYGPGLLAGATRIIQRIAQGKRLTIADVPAEQSDRGLNGPSLAQVVVTLIVLLAIINMIRRGGGGSSLGRRRGGWPTSPWAGGGWYGGLGGFGGGFGGHGGGGGGGFGGFGGGRSGGGGASGGW